MMKYSTYTGNLMWAVESASPASCKTPAKFIDFICPNNQAGQSKDTRNRFQLQTNCFVQPYIRDKLEFLKYSPCPVTFFCYIGTSLDLTHLLIFNNYHGSILFYIILMKVWTKLVQDFQPVECFELDYMQKNTAGLRVMSTYSAILYTHSNTHRHTTHHTPHTKTHKTKIITKELPCRLSYKKKYICFEKLCQ